jgi:hypothetical protein
MKKILLWTIGVIVVLAIVVRLLPDPPDHSKEQQAAIAIIKKSYTPSVQLLTWNPDFAGAQWVAVQYPEPLCAYSDCYQVSVSVDVIPGGEKKTIKAQWIVYAENEKYQADNAEARTLFVPAGPIPSPNDASPSTSASETVSPAAKTTLPLLTSKLTAISRTAEAITGDIEYSTDNAITILNKGYPLTLVHVLRGSEVEDAARIFSMSAPSADSSALRALYRINIPAGDKFLNGNTICGTASTRWVISLSDNENVDIWNIAFFSGNSEPNLESEANLCGTFRYQLLTR